MINPVSGVGKQKSVEKLAGKVINAKKIHADVVYTEYPGHASELAASAAGKYDIVVAVGGDGTVNEAGSALTGTETALAIIPAGSGNGLARHLGISQKPEHALRIINKLKTIKIDTVNVNDRISLNVSGVGFDAHISHLFAKMEQRGLASYVKLVAREFSSYRASKYTLTIDKLKPEVFNAFVISFANSSQYGNDFYIAPTASVTDGLIDLCIINKFPKIAAPVLLMSMMRKDNVGRYLEKIIKVKHFTIEHENDMLGHIDGEPVFFGKKVDISINPDSLNVIVP